MGSSGNASIKNTVIYKTKILNISWFKLVITVISTHPSNKQITKPIIAGNAYLNNFYHNQTWVSCVVFHGCAPITDVD